MPSERRRHPHLELLRVQGARQRLELSLALDDLARETGGVRRGVRVVMTLLRTIGGGQAGAPPAAGAAAGRGTGLLRQLLPLALALLAGRRAARAVGRVRWAVEAGTLGLLGYRIVRRLWRKPGKSTRHAQ